MTVVRRLVIVRLAWGLISPRTIGVLAEDVPELADHGHKNEPPPHLFGGRGDFMLSAKRRGSAGEDGMRSHSRADR